MSSRNKFWEAGYTVYSIPLKKPEIAALDMVLSSASKEDFGSKEINDIIYSLSDKFSGYRRKLDMENEK